MNDFMMVVFIISFAIIFTALGGFALLAILHKTRYWQRVSGEFRSLDLGELGRLEMTFKQRSYEDPELRIQHYYNDQPMQCEWYYWVNSDEGQRSAYETMVSAGTSWGIKTLCGLYQV